METFTVREKIIGDPSEVLRRVKDVNSIPLYWHGIKSLKVLSGKEGIYEVKVKFAFPGSSEYRARVTVREDGITIEYLEGPVTGSQEVTLKDEFLESTWNITLHGMAKVMGNRTIDHFREGTERALRRVIAGDPSL